MYLSRLSPAVQLLPVLSALPTGKVLGVVTPSLLLAWLRVSLSSLPGVAARLLGPDELPAVVCVQEDIPALDAFSLMVERRVSGLAVVNAGGLLSEVLCARDLRRLLLGGSEFVLC
jgi:hypothetical protein